MSISTQKYAEDYTRDEAFPYGCTSNMQGMLDRMNDWALRNKMELNFKKTKNKICRYLQ